ncbi:hypothetical protein [Rhizobium straminoryzae]|uniref:Uncharacterized protein n=1 Tax=Rhizobium straminoryzae TaxID=1387186 RepID=A0A549TD37_9HYPH|nr:hypothetical protein [Rhizobium straminoryzae]TRL39840.1 hypothetical protein FNA46_07855 [Rhizobium straminoryzae]
MNIHDIDAIEIAAAVGHMAAGQFFAILQDGDCWISPEIDQKDIEAIQHAALTLGDYACGRDLVPGQLMTFAELQGISTVDASLDAERARGWAYDLFTVTAKHAFGLIRDERKRLADAAAIAAQQESAKPLKLEDSIFEPHGSLGDQEPYQRQYLLEAAERAAREIEVQNRPAPLGEWQEIRPAPNPGDVVAMAAAIAIGQAMTQQKESEHEEEAADAGQAAGNPGTAAAATPPAVCAGGDAGSTEADAQAHVAGVSAAGEAGSPETLQGDDGAGAVIAPAEDATTTATGGKKPARAKSAN